MTAARPPASFVASVKALGRTLVAAGRPREEVETEQKAFAEKCGMDYDYEWSPFAGAVSFAEYDAYQDAARREAATYELMWIWQGLIENILGSDTLDMPGKAEAVRQATADFASRIGTDPAAVLEEDEGDDELEENGIWDGGVRSRIRKLLGHRSKRPAITPGVPAASIPVELGSFRAFKGLDGVYRWLAIYSNNFEDLEDEIFPVESHKEFVAWADKTLRYPELWVWHTKGTRLGETQMLDLSDDGFMVAAGVFDDDMTHAAESLERMGPQAVSHGYDYVKAGLVDGVYTKAAHYRTFEISVLPIGREANPIGTGFAAGQEVEMLTKEKRPYFTEIFGEDIVGRLEKSMTDAAVAARSKGVNFKELTKELGEAIEAPAPAAVAAVPAAAPSGDPPDLTAALTAALGPLLAPITSKLDALGLRLDDSEKALDLLQRSDDEKIAGHIAPRNQPPRGFVATEDPSTVARANSAEVKEAVKAFAATGSPIVDGAPEHLTPALEMLAGVMRTPAPVN